MPRLYDNFVGDHTAGVTPVPIPNTEVKPRWAHGTARETVWESRTSPALNQRPGSEMSLAFSLWGRFQGRDPSTGCARSGFRQQAPAQLGRLGGLTSLTPARRLKLSPAGPMVLSRKAGWESRTSSALNQRPFRAIGAAFRRCGATQRRARLARCFLPRWFPGAGAPRSRPSVLRSSSRSGQWMP